MKQRRYTNKNKIFPTKENRTTGTKEKRNEEQQKINLEMKIEK